MSAIKSVCFTKEQAKTLENIGWHRCSHFDRSVYGWNSSAGVEIRLYRYENNAAGEYVLRCQGKVAETFVYKTLEAALFQAGWVRGFYKRVFTTDREEGCGTMTGRLRSDQPNITTHPPYPQNPKIRVLTEVTDEVPGV